MEPNTFAQSLLARPSDLAGSQPIYAFTPDIKLTRVLEENAFTLSAEVIPPRNGSEQRFVLEQIAELVTAGAQFLSVTKGAGGSLRGGSLPIAQAIKERFQCPVIAHFTCRDLDANEVENQLIDHHYFGIRNILALRGDPPDGSPQGWTPKPGGYSYAYELIHQIRALNEGRTLLRANGPASQGQERTDFCIGAAAYPEFPDSRASWEYLKIKQDAGAEYALTDMCFSAETYARYLELCRKNGITIPILPGARILKSKAQALRMMSKFRVKVPNAWCEALPEQDAPENFTHCVDLFLTHAEELRRAGAPGLHVYVISDSRSAAAAIQRALGDST